MMAGAEVREKNTVLQGMKEICDYIRRSEATVLKLIREEDFPARKICGQWESDKEAITMWRKDKIYVNGR
jgi:hypothetical protein